MGELVPLNVGEIGGWGVAAFMGISFVLAFMRGYIYPRGVVKNMLEQSDKALQSERERADTWQTSWQALYDGRTQEAAGDRTLAVQTAELAYKALTTVQNRAERDDETP